MVGSLRRSLCVDSNHCYDNHKSKSVTAEWHLKDNDERAVIKINSTNVNILNLAQKPLGRN